MLSTNPFLQIKAGAIDWVEEFADTPLPSPARQKSGQALGQQTGVLDKFSLYWTTM